MGCAFVTTWAKTNEKYDHRQVYTGVQTIINMEYNGVSGNTAFLFMQASASNQFFLTLTMNKWDGEKDEPIYGYTMYKINEDFDFFNWDDFQRMALLSENKLSIIANSPDGMTVDDYYLMLTDDQIGSAYHVEFKSENKAGILKA